MFVTAMYVLALLLTFTPCTLYLFLPGVYIMSKSSGIMKIDSPGKLGPGLNIDQDVIRKQILAAKQVITWTIFPTKKFLC